MAHHAAQRPHQPLNLRLHTARRRLRKRYPRTSRTARRLRTHSLFTAYALITLVFMAWTLETICRIP